MYLFINEIIKAPAHPVLFSRFLSASHPPDDLNLRIFFSGAMIFGILKKRIHQRFMKGEFRQYPESVRLLHAPLSFHYIIKGEEKKLMDLRKLEYLESVYRLKSFTKAAKEQYVSQPSLSEAIMRLEEEMGAILIDRDIKPFTFTPAGEVFMKYVHSILSMVRAAREEVTFSASQSHTDIPFAWAGKYEDSILCELLETFAAEYPQYTLLPREGTSAQMLEQILKEEIEFAYLLIPENIDISVFHSQPLQCSILSVAVAKTNLLSAQKTVLPEQLLKENLYLPPKGAKLRSAFDDLVREHGLATDNLQVIPPFHMQRTLAWRNSGIYLTTRDDFGESSHDPDFTIVPIDGAPVFSKGIVTKRGRSPSAGAHTAITRILEIIQKLRTES